MYIIDRKQVTQLLVVFRFCKKVVDQLITGQGISYNPEDMLKASNGLSTWINILENALSE